MTVKQVYKSSNGITLLDWFSIYKSVYSVPINSSPHPKNPTSTLIPDTPTPKNSHITKTPHLLLPHFLIPHPNTHAPTPPTDTPPINPPTLHCRLKR